jgi:hypothetical protein
MEKNIEDYLINFPNFLDKEFCEKAVIGLDDTPDLWSKHGFYDPETDEKFNKSGKIECEILYSHDYKNPISDIIMKKLHPVIREYIDIFSFTWFSGWQGYAPIRFNRYSINHTMAMHCDHIHSMFDGERKGVPILSILGLLNDDFEGGQLIFFEDKKINIKQGDLLIFPSNFLYPHIVEPVTKGTRYTYVSWAW